MRDINMYGSTLKDVYDNFDTHKKGKMNYDSFCQMITAVGQDISKEEMKAAFDLID
jgi:Ca2+-binding EF-hand superfamily protein